MKRTPLYEEHLALKGHMVEFGGWEMPVYYTNVSEEHLGVREGVGLFDVSHMGLLLFEGEGHREFIQRMVCNDITPILGKEAVQYALLLNERGTPLDDILIYSMPSAIMIVVNAGNTDKAEAWFLKHKPASVNMHRINDKYALIALQGPKAEALLQPFTHPPLKELKYYKYIKGAAVDGHPAIISRTGYTGEAGFEIFVNPAFAAEVWKALLKAGAKPCGLGARDTLRLEVAFPLYGHEIDETITPLEAGLDRFVKFAKPDFMGKKALEAQQAAGVPRKLVGLELQDRAIARQGYVVMVNGQKVGFITSGTFSPTLKKSVAMAYVPASEVQIGKAVQVDVRGRAVSAVVVPLPFREAKRY